MPTATANECCQMTGCDIPCITTKATSDTELLEIGEIPAYGWSNLNTWPTEFGGPPQPALRDLPQPHNPGEDDIQG